MEKLLPAQPAPRNLLAHYLGLRDQGKWPTATQAIALAGQKSRNLQVLSKKRQEWAEEPLLEELRSRLAEHLIGLGGAALLEEAAEAVLRWQGALSNDPQERLLLARALLRMLIDGESCLTLPRFEYLNLEDRELLVDDPTIKPALLALGQAADRAVSEMPPPAESRLLASLKEVAPAREAGTFSESRLLKLAAALSHRARLSARQELYPVDMPPEESLRRARTLLVTTSSLTVAELERLLSARFPEAAPLPREPEALQRLFDALDLPLRWSEKAQKFESRTSALTSAHTSGSSFIPTSGRRDRVVASLDEAQQRGEPQVLMTRYSLLGPTVRWLESRYGAEAISLEAALLEELRVECERRRVRWELVVSADAEGPGGEHWSRVQKLVEGAAARLVDRLAHGERPLVLRHFALLARYDRLDVVDRLLRASGRPEGRPSVWLLAPFRDGLPTVEGRPLPLPPATAPVVVSAQILEDDTPLAASPGRS